VIKSTGKVEDFSSQKIISACERAKVPKKEIRRIVKVVENKIYNFVPTSEIRKWLIEELDKIDKKYSHGFKYKKKAVKVVGGYAFVHLKDRYENFSKQRIINSLTLETRMPEAQARELANKAEHFLIENNVKNVSGPLIREIVNYFLLQDEKLSKYYHYYQKIGMPVYDITKLINIGEKENANLQYNPETIHKLIADNICRRYALAKELPSKLADAHLTGAIHIGDLDYFSIRPFCFSHDLRFFFKHGLKADGIGVHTAIAGPAKKAEVAILHAAKVLASAQTQCAGGQGYNWFNILLAPFMKGMPYKKIKQMAQMFVYEMSMMYVSRGGQVVFSSIDIEPGIPKTLAKIPAVQPGGKIDQKVTYSDYYDESNKFFNAITDVYLDGDYVGKPFSFPKYELKLNKQDFKKYPNEMLKVSSLAAKFGTPYYFIQQEYLPEYSCYQCIHGDEKILVKRDGLIQHVLMRNVRTDDKVLSCSKQGKVSWKKITRKVEEPSLKELFEIKLKGNRTIKSSYDHLFIVFDNGWKIKRASELEVKDLIPIPKIIKNDSTIEKLDIIELIDELKLKKQILVAIENKKVPLNIYLANETKEQKTWRKQQGYKLFLHHSKGSYVTSLWILEEIAPLLGLYLAEGDINTSGRQYNIRLSFNPEEKGLISLTKVLMEKLGTQKVTVYTQKYGNYNSTLVQANNNLLGIIFDKILYLGKNAHEHSINHIFYNFDEKIIKQILKYYIKGDGHFKRSAKKALHLETATVSEKLNEEMQIMLLRTGVVSKITKHINRSKKDKEQPYFRLHIYPGSNVKKFLDIFPEISKYNMDGSSVEAFPTKYFKLNRLSRGSYQSSKLFSSTIQKHNIQCVDEELRKIIENNEIGFMEIEEIFNKGLHSEWYDIEVEDNHTFLVGNNGGMFVHNCCSYLMPLSDQNEDSDLYNGTVRGGALQVITINLPQIAYEAHGNDTKLFELLRKRMDIAKQIHLIKQDIVKKRMKQGLLPFLSQPVDDKGTPYLVVDKQGCEIGMVGLNEMLKAHTGEELHESENAWKFGLKVIHEMKKIANEYRQETGHLFGISRIPAESAAYRLAKIDLHRYKNAIIQGDKKAEAVYYTNSVHIRPSADVSLIDRLKKEAAFHPLLDGGAMSHVWLGEGEPNPEAINKLTERIAKKTLMSYFAYTRDLTVCNNCLFTCGGVLHQCPKCGSKNIDWYSRVTGYMQRVSSWNKGKQQEFLDRKRYSV